MKLIKSKFEIIDTINGEEILKKIEKVARTCYKSESFITEDSSSAKKLVSNLLKLKHEAMIEFCSISVKITCDRAVAQEWTRHRVASYAMESQRYCNYTNNKFSDGIVFIEPSWYESADDTHKRIFKAFLEDTEYYYNSLIKDGYKPQEARAVLPNCTKTELNCNMNLREWRHFFELRCNTAAHPDIRHLALGILKKFHELIPLIFDDLYEKFISTDTLEDTTN